MHPQAYEAVVVDKFYPPHKESKLNDTPAGLLPTGFELGLRWEKQKAQCIFGMENKRIENKLSLGRLQERAN